MQCIVWSPGVSLDSMERQIITEAFAFYRKNKSATATSLGISVRTLENKMERYATETRELEERQAAIAAQREEWNLRHRGMLPPIPSPKFEPLRMANSADEATPAGTTGAETSHQKQDDVDDLIGGTKSDMPPTPAQRSQQKARK